MTDEEKASQELRELREEIVRRDIELNELQRRYKSLTGQNYRWFK